MKQKSKDIIRNDYLESLDKDDCLTIIKYGLRGSDAPEDVNVEDIWNVIGSLYIGERM